MSCPVKIPATKKLAWGSRPRDPDDAPSHLPPPPFPPPPLHSIYFDDLLILNLILMRYLKNFIT